MPAQDATNGLYFRPFMFTKEAFLGVRPAQKVNYYLIASPAGAVLRRGRGIPAVDLAVHRICACGQAAAPGQPRAVATMPPHCCRCSEAHEQGCSQVLVLDQRVEGKYLEELGGMNVVLVTKDGTPDDPGTVQRILEEGITLERVLHPWPATAALKVEQRRVTIDRVEAGRGMSGEIAEMFACGTAAVITPIGQLKGEDFTVGYHERPGR